ncbi:Rieske (2Fe-2S) protein [Nocardia nova]|uniref:cholesterol 7-desaturase n=1 Tax=Nocardia nova TaxID=37330 RepID=A0A2S6AWG1_9NOCA|nr:Rieske 2Fe-2S domain-containing protein [Nocardia nova]PPJ33757.1 Rieske (2Fe-2S) protein [Nocardia nova]PPJ39550.1 Rieske (2Fe-2S) protein [Nocardia nova]
MRLHGLSLEITGWFQVAWSADFAVGQVVPLRYFGRDLVGYRGNDGVVRVQDRYCRHLGASLAHGGKVVDEGIQCPFHGWVWAPDGRNMSIPYQDRPSRARRLGCWPTIERNESIYIWFDAEGREPFFDVHDAFTAMRPTAGREFHPLRPEARQHFRDLRVHPQMVTENTVDPQHFRFVHGTPVSPVVLEETVEGPHWWARIGFGKGWTEHAEDADGVLRTDTENTIELHWDGLGASVTAEHLAGQGVRVIMINCTPVEDGRSEIFASYWVDRQAGDLEDGTYDRRLRSAKLALPDDIEIWNHQIYLDPPTLAGPEGPGFRKMRKWAKQFYPANDAVNGPNGAGDTRAPNAEKAEAGA